MKRTTRMMGPQYYEPVWLWTDTINGAAGGSMLGRKEESDRMMQPVQLENKVALIVGGANEKGSSLAVSFAERGMDVAIIFYDGREERAHGIKQKIEALGRRCLLLRGEDQESLNQEAFSRWAVARILDMFGRLDVFINISKNQFSLGALNGNGSHAAETNPSRLFPQFRIMKAALDEIVS